MKSSTRVMNGHAWKDLERKWKESFFLFLVSAIRSRLVPISSLSRPADNYVPRGETRWIGEIDRRDRCRLEAAVSAEGIQRKGTNPCAVKHEWATRFIDRDRGDNIPRPRRSKRGKTPITRGKHVWNITLGPKREIYLRFLLWKLVEEIFWKLSFVNKIHK